MLVSVVIYRAELCYACCAAHAAMLCCACTFGCTSAVMTCCYPSSPFLFFISTSSHADAQNRLLWRGNTCPALPSSSLYGLYYFDYTQHYCCHYHMLSLQPMLYALSQSSLSIKMITLSSAPLLYVVAADHAICVVTIIIVINNNIHNNNHIFSMIVVMITCCCCRPCYMLWPT